MTDRSLLSANSACPIAYYLMKRGLPPSFSSAKKYAAERNSINQWLIRSLLRGVFGSMGDTMLANLREVIKGPHQEFPSAALAERLQKLTRPIRFTNEDVDDLLAIRYGERQSFLVLSLLYPWIDYRNLFHVDHVHPGRYSTETPCARPGFRKATWSFVLNTATMSRISKYSHRLRTSKKTIRHSCSGCRKLTNRKKNGQCTVRCSSFRRLI